MTQFTSFVAVEEMTITEGGIPRKIEVPVELPEGVNRQGVFGDDDEKQVLAQPMTSGLVTANNGVGYGSSAGGGAGTESRRVNRKPDASKVKSRGDKSGRNSVVLNGSSGRVAESVDVVDAPARALTPKEKKAAELAAKLHPTIAALIERLKIKNSQAGSEENKFVRDGKAEIQIWLTDKSPQVMAELKKLGFEVVLDPQSAKMLIGRIAVDKLAALAEMKAVRFISPQNSK
jgi:hypothetical protein